MYQLSLFYDPMKFRHIKLYEELNEPENITILDNRRRLGKIKWLIRDNLINEREVEREAISIK